MKKPMAKCKRETPAPELPDAAGQNMPFMVLRHVFGLTKSGARLARGDAGKLMLMIRGAEAGLICMNCGLSMHDVLSLSRLGPWPVQCQPVGMRRTSREVMAKREASEMGAAFLCLDEAGVGSRVFVNFSRAARDLFIGLGGVPVLMPNLEIEGMRLPPGFGGM